MKRILSALLFIILLLFPSCDNEIKETEPTGNVERTEIKLYIDGELKEPDRNRHDILVFMEELSASKPSDTVTVTVKNTGKHPAHIYFNHQELDSCTIQSFLPEVLIPGQSADVKFTYNIPADKGLTPGSRVGNMNFNGNFDPKAIGFAGSKVDVPLLKLNYFPDIAFVIPNTIILGTEEMMAQEFNVLNFKSTGNDELVFQYQFHKPTENHYSIGSIDVLGKDAEYFTSIRSNERYLGLRFKPVETRKHTVTIRFHICSSDFKEYVRDLPLSIDVTSIDKSFFVNNEYHLNGYPNSSLFTMASSSNGHAYIYAVQGDSEGFIEIDENDQYVDWYSTQNIIHVGYPMESWFNEEDNAVMVLREIERPDGMPQFYLEEYGPTSEVHSEPIEFEGNETFEYACQSPDYLMFISKDHVRLYDKKNYKTIPLGMTFPTGSVFVRDVIYDSEMDSFVFVYDNLIWFTNYDRNTGNYAEGRELKLEDRCNGNLRRILKTADGYYVLNQMNELYLIKLTEVDFSVEKIGELKGYNPDEMYYSNNHLYFREEHTGKIFAYDLASRKIISIFELPQPYDYEYRYHLLEHNGNLYCTTTIRDYPYDQSGRQGYIRRIPLV